MLACDRRPMAACEPAFCTGAGNPSARVWRRELAADGLLVTAGPTQNLDPARCPSPTQATVCMGGCGPAARLRGAQVT